MTPCSWSPPPTSLAFSSLIWCGRSLALGRRARPSDGCHCCKLIGPAAGRKVGISRIGPNWTGNTGSTTEFKSTERMLNGRIVTHRKRNRHHASNYSSLQTTTSCFCWLAQPLDGDTTEETLMKRNECGQWIFLTQSQLYFCLLLAS